MRPIKFRVWDSLENKMVYFELKDYMAIQGMIAYTGEFYKNLSFMQFTGIHDKNGKMIWEGDIIACLCEPVCRVVYEPPSFVMTEFKHNDFDKYRFIPVSNSIEVLGNIYENPELLQGGNK